MVIIKFTFNANGSYEYPVLTLSNIDRTEMFIMNCIKNLVITPRLNSISDMSFKVYKKYNMTENPYYEYITKNKLVHIEGFGWWIIKSEIEEFDGGIPSKTVSCYSYEYTINYKGINLLNGTYKFYDEINPEDSLLYKLFANIPNWTIGHVDIELCNKYRTFDIPDANLYGFLMDDVSNSYQCIFVFDTENMTINAYDPKNIPKNTNIVMTFDNLIKGAKIEELDSDICTVLRVNGADNLSINVVNPLGDNRIFNFDYYKNDNWIKNNNIIDKINRWENEIENKKDAYSQNLKSLKIKKRELLTFKSQLNELKSKLESLEIVRKNLMPTDPNSPSYEEQRREFKKKTDEINKVESDIKNKEKDIDDKEKEINTINASLKNINDSVKFENYFDPKEKEFLSNFIIESVYTDSNFIVTDAMMYPENITGETTVLTTTGTKKFKDLNQTDVLIDEQYIANQLYEQGKEVLKKISQPSLRFSLDSVNFLFVEKFKPFIDELQLGSLINIQVEDPDNWVYPILLEFTIDYDNPQNFSMVFSNRFTKSEEWTFAELHNEQIKTSSQVGSTLQIASEPVLNGTVNKFQEYMNGNLIAANQQIQSTKDNEVTFGSFGIRGRKKMDTNPTGYDPHQLWINNNLICMTDDNWQSTKLAIGLINDRYCVNAEVIAGNLIAGSQLNIMSENGSFVVDSNGAKLSNASFEVSTSTNKIVLNPQLGIQLSQKNPVTGEFDTNCLKFTEAGILEFTGTLKAANGTFSGSLDAARGTFSGELKAATGTFSGEITADSGNIGRWIIKPYGLQSPQETIYMDSDGSISTIEFNADSGFVGNWKIQENTLSCGEIELVSTGTKKAYNKQSRKWEIQETGKGSMRIGKFLIDKMPGLNENYYIGGTSGIDLSQIRDAEWGMSANNKNLCFYSGYNGGNANSWDGYNFEINNDGRVSCRSIRLGGTEAQSAENTITSWKDLANIIDSEGGLSTWFSFTSPASGQDIVLEFSNGKAWRWGYGATYDDVLKWEYR